jgi:hypothetical protein
LSGTNGHSGSVITVTLLQVVNGNYPMHALSADEFNRVKAAVRFQFVTLDLHHALEQGGNK